MIYGLDRSKEYPDARHHNNNNHRKPRNINSEGQQHIKRRYQLLTCLNNKVRSIPRLVLYPIFGLIY